jgi:hypothetical protein
MVTNWSHDAAKSPVFGLHGFGVLRATLNEPGVYVLYRDDTPYYVGKTGKPLIKRVGGHALKPNWRRYNFWNYFSAFTIKDERHRDEVEAILISAMPTAANSSKPKIDKTHQPLRIRRPYWLVQQ